ncbi:MAG: hypothetical protein KDK03_04470 [Rhodobacteraceae bacterium]|nr:hypothetical protein [Paracoccaceae bacterium]
MSENRKIYFHIGAHKTASTFLQANLRASREALANAGLDVVLRQDVLATPFAKELGKVSQDRHDPEEISSKAAQSLRKVLPKGTNDVLVTCEDLVSSLKIQDFYQHLGKAAQYICKALPKFDVHFILYIRRQPDYIESVYMQNVHLGRSIKFERYLERANAVDLSWLKVADAMAGAVGPERVAVRPFETIRSLGEEAFLRQFLTICGLRAPEAFTVSDEIGRSRAANRSYSALAMKIARRVQPLLEEKQDQKALRKFLQENFSTATHPRAELLDESTRSAITARYEPSNRELFTRYDLGSDGKALEYY